MLYLIGLGLNELGISLEGMKTVRKCAKIYLEEYTIELPYNKKNIEKLLKKKIISLNRELTENMSILNEALNKNIALLVYGNPLIATTHISLLNEAKKRKIKYKIIHGTSIIDAISETGLQTYKFGKTTSIPKWDEKRNFKPTSFMNTIKENSSINAHTLILVDIGLEIKDAIKELKESSSKENFKLKEKIIICQSLGTKNSKIFYKEIDEFEKIKIKHPFCIIIPDKLHFIEEDFLKSL